MRRALAALALAAVALGAVAGTAAAQQRLTAKQVATALQARNAYVQPGITPPPDAAALAAVAKESTGIYLVILRRPLRGTANAKASANRVLEALEATDPNATVGLIVRGKLNGASLAYPAERIQKAVADTGATAADDPVGTLASFTAAVTKPNMADDGAAGDDAGGGTSWWMWVVLALLLAGIALVALRMRARSHEQRRRRRGGSLWTAREFHGDRLEALAARHAALTEETTRDIEDPEAAEHLQTAGARILALRRTLATLASPRELRAFAGELDAVEWEILWVEHRLSDHAPPAPIARGFPGLCFFSHEHGLGTEAIELRRPDGTVATVYVSPANRLALERGDAPEVSMVHVSAKMVPWPAAPSWYGAYGWNPDDLPGLEYDGEQIWGLDGPERDEDPFAEEPAADAAAPGPADAPVTREDELGETGERPGGWEPPADEQPAFDEPTVGSEPTLADEPTVASTPPRPPATTGPGFEELDEAAPAGLVEDAGEDPADDPLAGRAGDGEDTLDGRPAGESTLEWDPFDGDDRTR
jgi:hypothetical protein